MWGPGDCLVRYLLHVEALIRAPGAPRFTPQREVDELQIVVGGWQEAERQDIEGDVRAVFEALQALPLLKQVHVNVPYVRSGFCRVELVYPEHDTWKQKKLQGTVARLSRAGTSTVLVLSQPHHPGAGEDPSYWFKTLNPKPYLRFGVLDSELFVL